MDNRSTKIDERLQLPMLVASLLTIPSVVIEVGSSSPEWLAFALALDVVIWLAFLFEFVVMMRVVPDRREWVNGHKLEVFLLFAAFPAMPAGFGVLRVLRLLRVTRLARIAKIGRSGYGMKGLPYVALATALLVLAAGSIFAEVEASRHYSQWDGVWWAITTMSTVGYGDLSPTTTAGRLLAVFVMAIGIGFVAVLTAAFAQSFVAHELEDDGIGPADTSENSRHDEVMEQLRSIHDRISALEFKDLERDTVASRSDDGTAL